MDFFVMEFRRLRRCFPADASTWHILLYQDSVRLLLLNAWNYTISSVETQGERCYSDVIHGYSWATGKSIVMKDENQLTRREQEVAKLLLQGKSNKQIAAALHVTGRTVEAHLT